MCQSFELFESGRWHCKPEKMRLLVGLRELIRARFLGVRLQESCLPRRSLQLDPSLGRVSQVPGCSFRARRPTLPRKVLLELSVIFSLSGVGFLSVEDLGHFHLFSFRGFHTPGSLSLRLTLSHPRGSSRPVSHSTALAASCLMTLYMANSFYLARTTKLRLTLRRQARLRSDDLEMEAAQPGSTTSRGSIDPWLCSRASWINCA
jgi:hypothetical protein